MDKILKDVLNYEKIIIVSNEEDDLLSKMIFDSIKNSINNLIISLNDKYGEKLVKDYKYDDLFNQDVSNYILKKYYNGNFNYLLRFRGNGYNVGFMGLIKSQQTVRDAHLILGVRHNKCTILHDRLNDYLKRECDLNSLYRSIKITNILKNING